jgi:hypothetical protein
VAVARNERTRLVLQPAAGALLVSAHRLVVGPKYRGMQQQREQLRRSDDRNQGEKELTGGGFVTAWVEESGEHA